MWFLLKFFVLQKYPKQTDATDGPFGEWEISGDAIGQKLIFQIRPWTSTLLYPPGRTYFWHASKSGKVHQQFFFLCNVCNKYIPDIL